MKETTEKITSRKDGTFIVYQDFGSTRKVYETNAQTNITTSYQDIAYRAAMREFVDLVKDSIITGASVKLMFGRWSETDQALINVQEVKIS